MPPHCDPHVVDAADFNDKAVHYDYGNGIAVADVDGDGDWRKKSKHPVWYKYSCGTPIAFEQTGQSLTTLNRARLRVWFWPISGNGRRFPLPR
jgi:hypothetical protein